MRSDEENNHYHKDRSDLGYDLKMVKVEVSEGMSDLLDLTLVGKSFGSRRRDVH